MYHTPTRPPTVETVGYVFDEFSTLFSTSSFAQYR